MEPRNRCREFGKYVEFDHKPTVRELAAAAKALWASLEGALTRAEGIAFGELIVKNKALEAYNVNDPLSHTRPKLSGWTVGLKLRLLLGCVPVAGYIDGDIEDGRMAERIDLPPEKEPTIEEGHERAEPFLLVEELIHSLRQCARRGPACRICAYKAWNYGNDGCCKKLNADAAEALEALARINETKEELVKANSDQADKLRHAQEIIRALTRYGEALEAALVRKSAMEATAENAASCRKDAEDGK